MTNKKRMGFAALSGDARSKIASLGGIAAHAKGKAHRFTSDKAREAGRIGGRKTSQDREHMSVIGAIGGSKRRKRKDMDDGIK